MPLLAGSHKPVAPFRQEPINALYALENAFSKNQINIKVHTEFFSNITESYGVNFDSIGFTGWKLVWVNEPWCTYSLFLLPPGYSPGNYNLVAPGILTVPNCCSYLGPDPFGAGVTDANANCLVAHDVSFNSVLIAFYGSIHGPAISGEITLHGKGDSISGAVYYDASNYGLSGWHDTVDPAILFLAKDTNGDIFGGGGCGHTGFPFITSLIGKNGHYRDLLTLPTNSVGGWNQIRHIKAYPPFYPRPNFNNKNMLYLADMVNYSSDSLALAKSMKTGITVPKQSEDYTKFITCYRVNDQKFINFRNHGTPYYHVPLLDPWCPF